jgi:hypothetical protein
MKEFISRTGQKPNKFMSLSINYYIVQKEEIILHGRKLETEGGGKRLWGYKQKEGRLYMSVGQSNSQSHLGKQNLPQKYAAPGARSRPTEFQWHLHWQGQYLLEMNGSMVKGHQRNHTHET